MRSKIAGLFAAFGVVVVYLSLRLHGLSHDRAVHTTGAIIITLDKEAHRPGFAPTAKQTIKCVTDYFEQPREVREQIAIGLGGAQAIPKGANTPEEFNELLRRLANQTGKRH